MAQSASRVPRHFVRPDLEEIKMAKPKVVFEATGLSKNYSDDKGEKVKHRVVRDEKGEYCIETLNFDVMGGKRWEQVKTDDNNYLSHYHAIRAIFKKLFGDK